jgi:type II secretory pathway component PulC
MTPTQANQFKAQQKIKGIENQGNKYIISKELLDEKLKDIAGVLSEARAVKIQNPDGTLSFKMTEIEAGGIFSYLGIQNEDIITSINGKPITDLNEIMALFGRIKNIDQLQLGVRRDGEDNQMDYQMKK